MAVGLCHQCVELRIAVGLLQQLGAVEDGLPVAPCPEEVDADESKDVIRGAHRDRAHVEQPGAILYLPCRCILLSLGEKNEGLLEPEERIFW